jgi:DNA-binding transcriptional LysR family regulator
MSVEQLKNFLIVAQVLNFRKATEKIYIAQPALSRQVQQLEMEIGAQLFDRSKKQIKLTVAGEFFRSEAERIVEQLEQAKKKTELIHKGMAGELTIGHVSSAMQSVIPGFLKKIQSIIPDLKIGLLEEACRMIFIKISNRELDFGIVPNETAPATINSSIIYKENFVVITPASYNLSKKNFKDLRQFADANWILPPQMDGLGYSETLYRIFQKYGFRPKVAYESPNSSTSLRLVSAGLGVTMIGKSALNGLDLDIKYFELTKVPEKIEMRLVWLRERERELNQYITLFQKFLK